MPSPIFSTLNNTIMLQHIELWNAVNPVAERIRLLGQPAPGTNAKFGKLASVPDPPATPPKALEMACSLLEE